jgi:hypothetical protein
LEFVERFKREWIVKRLGYRAHLEVVEASPHKEVAAD